MVDAWINLTDGTRQDRRTFISADKQEIKSFISDLKGFYVYRIWQRVPEDRI